MVEELLESPKHTITQKKKLGKDLKSCLEKAARVSTELMIGFLSLFKTIKLTSDEVSGSQYVPSMPPALKAVVSWQVNLITAG